jgi:4-amino-4-deoxy-L-arabinose transferase-like glycosyltransferase
MTWLWRQRLLVILLLAFGLRMGVFFAFPAVFAFDQTDDLHGSRAYDEYAQNLLATGVYGRSAGTPDAIIPPLYSVVVAAVYGVAGRSATAIALVHSALDLISIALLYHIVRRLFRGGPLWGQPPGEWAGLLAALLMAFYPYLVFQNLTLNDTALFIALMHGFILAVVLLRERPRMDRAGILLAALAGVVLGLATLGRAQLVLFAPFVGLWFLFRLDLRQTITRLLPVALISLLVLLPWMARNYGVYGQFVALSLNSGENVYQGNNAQTVPFLRAGYDVQWVAGPGGGTGATRQAEDAYQHNEDLMNAGLAYLRANPSAIPELLWVKFQVHWSVDVAPRNNPLPGQKLSVVDGQFQVQDADGHVLQDVATIAAYSGGFFEEVGRPLHRIYFGVLLALAAAGVLLSLAQWREVSLLWFVQIAATLTFVLFHPSTRYRAPTDPLLFAFAAFAVVWLAQRWWARRSLNPAGSAA